MSHSSLSPGLSRRRSAVLATLIVLLAAAAWATHQHDRFAEAAAIASAPAAGVLLVGRTRGWFSHRRDSNTTGPWPTGANIAALVTLGLLGDDLHGALIGGVLSFEAFIVLDLLMASWFRRRRGADSTIP